MPRVMRACRPEHEPSDQWGEDCPVQWGGGGVVMSVKGGYRTAFFEVFPKTGSGFIRGEGGTVPEAEEAALRKRRREMACPAHVLGRRGYNNGVLASLFGDMELRGLRVAVSEVRAAAAVNAAAEV